MNAPGTVGPDDLAFVAALAAERAGLAVPLDRGYLIEARLAPLARREALPDVAALVAVARAAPDGPVAASLVEALASADTAFFRDRQAFDRLQAEILPALAARREGGAVRLWSVGCGGGQEVYSVAMAAAEAAAPSLSLQLFASDLSPRALQKAKAGAYTHFEVQRGLPVRLLLRWFEKAGETWRVSPDLRQQVRWAPVNLMDDLSRLGSFDVILCRNVLSGFTPEAAAAALAKLESILAPDGVLMTGAAEAPALGAGFRGRGGLFLREPQPVLRVA